MEFIKWLQKEKNYKEKSAYDVASRLKRVKQILGTTKIPMDALEKIEKNDNFLKLTVSVKSQLRISLRLYNEYKNSKWIYNNININKKLKMSESEIIKVTKENKFIISTSH